IFVLPVFLNLKLASEGRAGRGKNRILQIPRKGGSWPTETRLPTKCRFNRGRHDMVEIATLDVTRANVAAAEIATLRHNLRGAVVLAGDADFETARRVWNGNVDRRPALIVRCTGIADVQHAVNLASTNGFLVSVRSGGHSAPGYGTNDGGMVIDLSPMKTINV